MNKDDDGLKGLFHVHYAYLFLVGLINFIVNI